MHYPSQLEIVPLVRPPLTEVRVPGSKSITNRALVLAALTASREHDTVLEGALQCEDTEVMVACLRRLGFDVNTDWATAQIRVRRPAKVFSPRPTGGERSGVRGELFVANSGTTMRFLTAMVALGHGQFRLDGVPRMRERPIGDLLDALHLLGVQATSESGNGCPPVLIVTNGLRGGSVRMKGNTSSQFLSGLLLAAPFAQGDIMIEVDGPLVSEPYVNMTIAMMRQFGLAVVCDRPGHLVVPAPQQVPPLELYRIEPDASAASYFFAAAAITGGSVSVVGLPTFSLQGDVRFVEVIQQMGCKVERSGEAITVRGGPLQGIDVDMNDISDTVMTLAAVACFAQGPTTIRHVAHIRHKETDRITALATELRRIGAQVTERGDGLTITPAPLHGSLMQTYNDHRMAMSLALVGLKIPGIVIDQPTCVAKTYPRFFDDLERLRFAKE